MENNNKKRQETIDRYLMDEMTPAEKNTFEAQLTADPELRQQTELSRHIIHALQHDEEQAAFRAMQSLSEKELKNLIGASQPEYRKQPFGIRLAVAAAAVILLLLYIGTRPQHSTEELFAGYYTIQPYESFPIRGGNELTIEKRQKIKEAKELYEQEEYQQALHIYNNSLLPTGKPGWTNEPEELIFYAAICEFETGNLAGSTQKLTWLAASAEFDFQEEALWNLAFIYLKENKRNKARNTLKQLIAIDGDYTEKAKQLLDELNKKRWF